MDNKLLNLTVVIVTFRTDRSILKNCLDSIDEKVKVLIVENSKNFINYEEIKNKYNNVEIICSGSNLGMGAGNNFGVKNTKTDYVLILNPDTICEKSFFTNISEYLNNSTDYAIIGCQYLNNDIYKPAGFFDKKKNKEIVFNQELTPVEWVVGCSMLVNMNKFENRKLFDENFFLFFEEFDLCKNLVNKKQKIFSSNKLIINHLGFKGSFAVDEKLHIEASKLRNWHYMWSQFYFNKKNGSLILAYWKGFFNLLQNLFKSILYSILKKKDEKIKYKYRFLGLWNSLLGRKSTYRINF